MNDGVEPKIIKRAHQLSPMRFCRVCTHPNTRPRIAFSDDDICNGCLRTDEKHDQIDWKAREDELKEIVARAMESMPDRHYDCIVPVSGGKDSTFQAWYAAKKLGLKVLCVNNSPFLPTDVGIKNLRNLADRLPVDLVSVVPNQEVYAKLSRTFFEQYGDPLMHNIYLLFSGVTRVAMEKRVPIIFFGENGDREYAGSDAPEYTELDNKGVHARIRSDKSDYRTPDRWHELGIDPRDLLPYQEPTDAEIAAAGVKRLFLSDYLPWNNNYHLHVSLNVVGGFEMSDERAPGTYTFGYSTDNELYDVYIWMLYPKFGFGRATKYTSKDIQEGKISREQAIGLVRDYDGEFPWHAADSYVAKTGMTMEKFWDVVASFIGDEDNLRREAEQYGTPMKTPAWEKIGDRKWRLRNTVYEDERTIELPIARPLNNA